MVKITAVTVARLFALLVLVKILDRSLGMFEEIGEYAPFEMLMPLLVVIAIARAWRAGRSQVGETGASDVQRHVDCKSRTALRQAWRRRSPPMPDAWPPCSRA